MKKRDKPTEAQTTFLDMPPTGSKPKKSFRLQFNFWLDMFKPEEQSLAETIDLLKQGRLYSRAIRDGIRLWIDLRSGNTDVLEELFPNIVQKIRGKTEPPGEQFERMIGEIAGLKSVLSGGTPARIAEPIELSGSIFATETVEVVSASDARQEFAAGFGNLFSDDDDDLWD